MRLVIRSVGLSSRIVVCRFVDSSAKIFIVALKFVTKSCSWRSLRPSAAVTLARLSNDSPRSSGSPPRTAWLTMEAFFSAGPA